ncbi:RRNA methyltransferase AviRa [Pseudonocardia sp. Ae168_Ps1]|uniref:hypothetical protein n=1 Tax=Pseudonocardia sp. Ae150A_Ps1 TaxID=1885028 RepID=UPI00095DEFAD|nr:MULTISPECIES: hypothetical protein [unclassified Pseudonocardia]OLL74752.1 RRNA methyltransferase AviRa [Pseudonocardia sp. Ae150A_Ps1]OLL80734.1 RRNA methyltransferase AviRa [Pseudonocardia sp. Ae168_Ps1]OLL85138.1 RRNA methyltransferase AviRa [Pseudonocardia sp. Ae263_Ps1]OLL94836.1 RRNA methyltransferase AviRa [Pseudonocardia sp. Ae356_Ps1]
MQYRHAPAANHAALDAVLVSAPGRPTLPVRLTVELAGRARERLGPGPVTVWDPCCGAGVSLAVLGLLCPGIAVLAGTDADPAPLGLARRNLGLLAPGGLDDRASTLDGLAARHGKESYAVAAAAARATIPASRPEWRVGVADAGDPEAVRTRSAASSRTWCWRTCRTGDRPRGRGSRGPVPHRRPGSSSRSPSPCMPRRWSSPSGAGGRCRCPRACVRSNGSGPGTGPPCSSGPVTCTPDRDIPGQCGTAAPPGSSA